MAIELAGFGDSGNNREEWTMEAYGKDVAAVLDKLELKESILIGLSMGAPVVIETAELFPETLIGIVLVDFLKNIEAVYSESNIINIDETLMDLVTEPTIEKAMSYYTRNKEVLGNRYIAMVKEAPKVGWSESIFSLFRWCNENCIESIEKVKVPITSINSDQEPTNVLAFKKYAPSYKAKIITDVGHYVHWEAPDEFNRLLEETIQEFIQMEE